jgi:hypothetical protein
MCTYSLVPITLAFRSVALPKNVTEVEYACAVFQIYRFALLLRELFHTFMIDTITTHQHPPLRSSQTHQLPLIKIFTTSSKLLKNKTAIDPKDQT